MVTLSPARALVFIVAFFGSAAASAADASPDVAINDVTVISPEANSAA